MTNKILIADDTKINLSVLKTVLIKQNYIIDTASNGHEVIEMFEEGKYDIMFLDIQMPDMNGDDAFLKIKEKYKQLPYTIAFSATDFPDEINNYLEIGFDDFMPKPITEIRVKMILDKFSKKTTDV